jgi:hypothetical protein
MAKTETLHIDVRPHIAAVARPGDTVLIGFNTQLDDESLSYIDEQFREWSEQTGVKVALIADIAQMVVVQAPDDEDYPDAGR